MNDPAESRLPSPSRQALQRPALAALVVFCIGMLLTGASAVWQARVNAAAAAARFDTLAVRTVEQIAARVEGVERGLRGARGAVVAAGTHEIDRRRFRAYGQSRDFAVEFPGAHGFGVIRRVPAVDEAGFVAAAKRDGAPEFAIRQLEPHAGDRYVVQYIEPVETNAASLGLDIASEANRREAAEVSMRTGAATLTGPITLVQASGLPMRSFLVLLPIYEAGRNTATPQAREAATFGWAFAQLAIDDVLKGFDFQDGEFAISLKDVSGADARVFFTSPETTSPLAEGLSRKIVMPVFGRSWQFDVHARERFVESLGQRSPGTVAAIGIVLSGLLTLAFFLHSQSFARAIQVTTERGRRAAIAEDIASAMLIEEKLRASESFLDRTGAIAGVGGWELDLRTGTLTWTAQTYRIHEVDADFKPELATAVDFYPGAARGAIERAVATAIETGAEWDLELPFVTAKGREIWVRAVGAAERENGECVRLAGAFQDITERKCAESLLAHERHLMASLLETAPDQIYFKDRNSRFMRINPGLARRYGLADAADAVGKSDADFFTAEHAERTAAIERQIMVSGEPVLDLEEEEAWQGRAPSWNLTTKMPLRDVAGQVIGIFGISRDITARKQMDAQLQQTNERFSMASDSAGIGVWEFDVVTDRLKWDAWMYRLYGVTRSSAPASYDLWASSLHPEDRARCESEIALALQGAKELDTEFRIVRPDGEVRHIKSSARTVRNAQGVAIAMTGVNFDVTERRQAEAEARRSSELMRGAIEAIDEAFVIFDPQDRVLYCNEKCRELYKTSANLIVPGKTFEEILRGGAALGQYPAAIGRIEEWIAERLEVRRRGSAKLVTRLDDGRVLRVIDRRMPDGHTVGFRVDITEQVRATEAAQAASQAKSQFLANMSHEIRSPMNAVIGLAYLLRQTRLSAEQSLFVNKMTTASKSLLAVINDVLDLSKIEAGELLLERGVFSPHRLIREQADLIGVSAQAKGIGFEVEIVDDLPEAVEGDAKHLGQVLGNLLSNAVKFTDRGSVALRVGQAASQAGGVTLCFTVRDTGIGIAPALHASLFKPFVQADDSITRRFGGTGLGLSIVKHLVELMGGSIAVNSEPDIGSEFIVTLQFATASAALLEEEGASDAAPGANALAGVRVLVVDDSQINVDVAKRILELQGAQVGTAGNGLEAFETLRAAPDAFDVVLMDVQMPVLDGIEATRRIRADARLATLPVIALTAGALGSERQSAMAAGMNDFMVKPFAARELTLCIKRHARERSSAPARVDERPVARESDAADPWPSLPGIDAADVQERLGGDLALFNVLLARLLGEFGSVSAPSPDDEEAVVDYAQAMHKLCGSAGMLGARSIHRMAIALEAACAPLDIATLRRLTPMLAEALHALGASHQASLARMTDTMQPEPPPAGTAMDRSMLIDLITLLRQQNLSALVRFKALSPQLRQMLGDGPYGVARGHVDSLRFHEAAESLESLQP